MKQSVGNEVIVMCIYGEGELCDKRCPLMKKCWPTYKDEDTKTA